MKRAAITYFCGDPIITYFWLLVYEKYWRGQVDKVIAGVHYNMSIINDDLINLQKSLFKKYPEIVLLETNSMHGNTPENINGQILNSNLLEEIDTLFFTETDAFIFDKNVVDYYFEQVEYGIINNQRIIVTPDYRLLPDFLLEKFPVQGIMRSMLFCEKEIILNTSKNFYPARLKIGELIGKTNIIALQNYDLDCFGLMSIEILNQTNSVHIIKENCLREDLVSKNPKWVHIRQFNSSLFGFGVSAEACLYTLVKCNKKREIEELRRHICTSEGKWQLIKSIIFRKIFLHYFPVSSFKDEYNTILEKTIDVYGLDRNKIITLSNQWKSIINL